MSILTHRQNFSIFQALSQDPWSYDTPGESPDVLRFEDALSELEKIVQQLEGGELSLDESLSMFEQGVKLSRLCHQRLDEAEKKIEALLTDGTRAKLDPEDVDGT